jgi:hypothetical protein
MGKWQACCHIREEIQIVRLYAKTPADFAVLWGKIQTDLMALKALVGVNLAITIAVAVKLFAVYGPLIGGVQ